MADCLNCDSPLTGPYCAACGQRHIEQLTMREWFADAVRAFTDIDTAPLLTLRELTIRPGLVASHYVAGQRAKYVNPLRYALVASAIFLACYALGRSSANAASEQSLLQATNLLAAPAIAVPVWLVFRSSGRSYVEQLTLQLYIRGHSLLLLALLLVIGRMTGADPGTALTFIIGFPLIVWSAAALVQFHAGKVTYLFPRTVVGLVLAEAISAGIVFALRAL